MKSAWGVAIVTLAVLQARLVSSQVQSKVDHLVVLLVENRGFDHIFGCAGDELPGIDGIEEGMGNWIDPSNHVRVRQLLLIALSTETHTPVSLKFLRAKEDSMSPAEAQSMCASTVQASHLFSNGKTSTEARESPTLLVLVRLEGGSKLRVQLELTQASAALALALPRRPAHNVWIRYG